MNKNLNIEDVKSLFVKRDKDCNKGNFGYVGVMGGCPSYSGAVKLANMSNINVYTELLADYSMASLRSGCGVSKLIIPKSISTSVAPYLLESTLYEMPCDDSGFMMLPKPLESDSVSDSSFDNPFNKLKSLSVGMGWGQSDNYISILKYILNSLSLNLIIDADGLNMLSKMLKDDEDILKNTRNQVVLTPHLMEFSRISGYSMNEIKSNRVELAKKFAIKHNVILLLKGAKTIVTDGNDVLICDRGTPGMATAGSGDVLSGILTGLLGYLPMNIYTIAAGAYINGMAGEFAAKQFTEISMTAGDTVKMIPEVMKGLYEM